MELSRRKYFRPASGSPGRRPAPFERFGPAWWTTYSGPMPPLWACLAFSQTL